jgi:hypothetical protein
MRRQDSFKLAAGGTGIPKKGSTLQARLQPVA